MYRKLLTGSLVAALMAGSASADTLREALVSTYLSNPTLTAQREGLKATDAGVAIARAPGRPSVSGTVSATRDLERTGALARFGSFGPFLNGGVNVAVPLYQGGTVSNGIRAAKSRVEAGRATLLSVEGNTFTEAVTSYMDVIRDRATVELNANNVKVLETNLEATRDRFQIGDLTRTDVAQSEARLQLGRSNLAAAQGRLAASEENYRRIIGKIPGSLAPPPPLPPLPTTADEAVRIALANNPGLLASRRQAEAAGYDVRAVRGTRLPSVSGIANANYTNTLAGEVFVNPITGQANSRWGASSSVGVQARIPLYQGGLPGARIRQAQAVEGQAFELAVGTERTVISQTRSAFAAYDAARNAIQANTVAVQAAELALEGNRAEQSVGTRTVIEVLNAEQDLLNAQVALVTAKRDAYVAGFQLLNAMGQAEAEDLGLDGGPLYDPLGNYRRVANDWNDWSNDPQHRTVATRTATPQELPPNPVLAGPQATSGVTPPQQ
ncbi:MAG: TolC family outer membrane protein [Pseudomonadota bacterium]